MNKLFKDNVLSDVIFTKCTFICPVSSAQNFCDWNTLNIRIGHRKKAPLTLCALKTEVSMPALDRTDLIHLPTVEVVTGL